jgi:exosortase/archaeosortase family protein
MLTVTVKSRFDKVPAPARLFAKRALLLFAAWILIYYGLLKPYRIPDRWLSNITAGATANLLNLLYAPATSTEIKGWSCVIMNSRSVIRVGDPCNGLDLFVLYCGFMLCVPTSKKRLLLFSLAGFAVIFILNVLRCSALAWLALNKHQWVEFAHKYAFTAIVYCTIFYGWVLYTKKYNIKDAA